MSNCDDEMKELERLLEESKASSRARTPLDIEMPPLAETPLEAPPPAAPPEVDEASESPAEDSALAVRAPSALLRMETEPTPEATTPEATTLEATTPEATTSEVPITEAPAAEVPTTEVLAAEVLASEAPTTEVPMLEESALEELEPEELSPEASTLDELLPEELLEEVSTPEAATHKEPALQLPEEERPQAAAPREAFVSSWPARQHVSPAVLALDSIEADDTFRLSQKDDSISALAVELSRLGQLMPIDVRMLPSGRFQVIVGFRRVEALRFLHRNKVVARIHMDLSDTDAWLLALASSLYAAPASRASLVALKNRLEEAGQLQPVLRDMLECALHPAKEASLEEVEAEELAREVAMRMAALNQDLSLVADVFLDLEPSQRVMLLKQLRYASAMVSYLERLE